jgi:hypothetical protein
MILKSTGTENNCDLMKEVLFFHIFQQILDLGIIPLMSNNSPAFPYFMVWLLGCNMSNLFFDVHNILFL